MAASNSDGKFYLYYNIETHNENTAVIFKVNSNWSPGEIGVVLMLGHISRQFGAMRTLDYSTVLTWKDPSEFHPKLTPAWFSGPEKIGETGFKRGRAARLAEDGILDDVTKMFQPENRAQTQAFLKDNVETAAEQRQIDDFFSVEPGYVDDNAKMPSPVKQEMTIPNRAWEDSDDDNPFYNEPPTKVPRLQPDQIYRDHQEEPVDSLEEPADVQEPELPEPVLPEQVLQEESDSEDDQMFQDHEDPVPAIDQSQLDENVRLMMEGGLLSVENWPQDDSQ